ncbi:Alpha/Beta hydrolase protein [Melanogaster broomeanus]|nr:Alpha/Beta hydrolase protein [Melanogaster broomeanus]
MTSVPSATVWGSPTATKHALLLHGLTSSSHTWHKVAPLLVAQGYFVTAPNLLGHGSRRSTDYPISSIVEDLHPYFSQRNYDLIIGHSLGALTIMSLFPYLSQPHPTAIVLVDPPLQVEPEAMAVYYDPMFSDSCINIKSAEVYLTENSLWTPDDGVFRELGTRLCAVEAIHDILKHQPWNFIPMFNTVSPKWKVTVLIADPALYQCCFVDDIKPFPHVRPVSVSGAGHWIQYEFPEVVAEEALKTVAELE